MTMTDDATPAPLDLDGKPFCPTGYAQRYHAIGECDQATPAPLDVDEWQRHVIAQLDAQLAAERARHAALAAAAGAVCQAWIADEAGEETFDPNLIDALGDALYRPEEARK